jgi:hypothetical protein
VTETSGWLVYASEDGTFGLAHSAGWYIVGFESRAEAVVWLQGYLVAQTFQMRQERLARDRMLAELEPHGRVS